MLRSRAQNHEHFCPTAAALFHYSFMLERVPDVPPPAKVHDAPQSSMDVCLH